ncbi:MAG: flagellar biosynthesis protein FlhF [Casimicrobiaceae bacterium]
MNVKQFVAANAREALQQVKRELGANAVILSNRSVDDGVEILAITHAEAAALDTVDHEPVIAGDDAERELPAGLRPRRSQTVKIKTPQPAQRARTVPPVFTSNRSAPAQAPAPAPAPQGEHMVREVIREIQSMRGLINDQLSGMVYGQMQRHEPEKLRHMSTLLGAGFSPALSRRLLEKAPTGAGMDGLKDWIRRALDKNLITGGADDIVAKGGVYALLGPTGVGKTTTTAKLAARCVIRHGASKLALLTTDNYRVGAHEHLRIYGRILGVQVHAVRDAADLQAALKGLRDKHMVLVDTVGMSQKDRHVAEQVAMFSGHGEGIKRLLLLNATCQGDTLEDVVNAYKGGGLDGCLITKTDEAASLGAVLDTVIRHRLMVHYVANGQRVPEDIHPADRDYLLHRALATPRDNPVRKFAEQDIPAAMMGAQYAL